MSTRSKGDKRERQCKNRLQQAGWTVHKKVNNTYDNSDIWGLFDVIATKNGEKPLFIQVKSNTSSGAMKQLREAQCLNLEHMNIQLWIAHDYQGWRIKELEQEKKWIQTLDEREYDTHFGEEVVKLYQSQ